MSLLHDFLILLFLFLIFFQLVIPFYSYTFIFIVWVVKTVASCWGIDDDGFICIFPSLQLYLFARFYFTLNSLDLSCSPIIKW